MVFPTPLCVERWDPSGIDIQREHFRQLLDPKWTKGHREALQQSMRLFMVRVIDLLQDTLVRLIQRFWQFLEDMKQIARETLSQNLQLAVNPSKPA